MAFVLEPTMPVDGWLKEMSAWLERSPGFFAAKPVILDVASSCEAKRDLVVVVDRLEKLGVRVMGIDGAKPDWLGAGLPPAISGGRNAAVVEMPSAEPAVEAPQKDSTLIEQPVRSGQTIYADGDVVVLGSVASGAEIVAGGSIHVYGALRGRAIAGATGNGKARIFARRFEPELLAIDGLYRTVEDLDPAIRGKAAQARLSGDSIEIAVMA